MRRIAIWAGLCLFLLGSALAKVHAQQISIAGDTNSPDMTMDISLRDADLNEVLTAMFNTTGGKYQLQVGNGVVGRIPRLQLIQTPFDKALDAILGTDYSYTRRQIGNGNYLYTISGRGSASVPDTGGAAVPTMAPATTSSTAANTDSTTSSPPTLGATTPGSPSSTTTPPTLLTITQKKAGTGKPGEAATTETLVVNTININNLDIEQLCSAIGGTAVKLFVQNQTSTSSGMPSTGMNGNNNNGNNNNGYNNGNNNNNNNNNNGYNNGNNNNSYGNNSNSYNNGNNNNSYNNGSNNNSNRYSSTSGGNNYSSGGYSSGNTLR